MPAAKGAVLVALIGGHESGRKLLGAAKLHYLGGSRSAEVIFENHIDDKSWAYDEDCEEIDEDPFFDDLLA